MPFDAHFPFGITFQQVRHPGEVRLGLSRNGPFVRRKVNGGLAQNNPASGLLKRLDIDRGSWGFLIGTNGVTVQYGNERSRGSRRIDTGFQDLAVCYLPSIELLILF